MKRILSLCTLVLVVTALALPFADGLQAAGPEWIVVGAGETLTTLAQRHGVSIDALIKVNNLPNANFIYSGQRLLIPDPLMTFSGQPQQSSNAPGQQPANVSVQQSQNASSSAPQSSDAVFYTVRPGDTLAAIASRYGVSVAAIAQANNLTDWNFVWYGQRLRIPGTASVNGVVPPAPAPSAPQPAVAVPVNAPTPGKWIDINVSDQTISAYEGATLLKTVVVSTGTARTPTVLGTYKILSKYPAVHMRGGTPGVDYYDLPNVPWTMFFYQGYAIHGTYWHTNFGTRMSHGCVNLPTDDAKWFYDWATVGTPVVSHQ
ncbi:MAG: LysM peptidoglycan-binding domain-containing protein [Anaerolineae bacterium]|nr:LysM peptidoglycan-binding domain-containing protein [Anaerolineae bacterium]